jgi:hypothetical protein
MIFQYKIYTNETIDLSREYIMFDGYRPGAHMKLAYSGDIRAESVQNARERLFETFNINHPVDYIAHSLSVGDVIVLNDIAYACGSVGWKQLDEFKPEHKNPAWIDTEEYFKNQAKYEATQKELRSKI